MSNVVFPKLPYTKLHSWMFNSLVGIDVPEQSKTNTGNVGSYIDNYIKTKLHISNLTSNVDLAKYGIEIKSKELSTRTDWSIGSMTLEDIINTPYLQSPIYQKLQGLLLVTTTNTFLKVKNIGLYYFDFDEVQLLLEKSYEDCRKQLQNRVSNHAKKIAQEVKKGNHNAILEKISFKSYEKFKSDYGKFEYMNSGTSFQFRITVPQMRHLTKLAATQNELIVL